MTDGYESLDSLLERETYVYYRKLRKKLRQIEKLKLVALDRKLSEEEQVKVNSQRLTEQEIEDFLKSNDVDKIVPVKRPGDSLDDSEIATKKVKTIKCETLDESKNTSNFTLNSSSGSSNLGFENTGSSSLKFCNEAISPQPESTVKDSAPRSQKSSSFAQTQGECSPAIVKTENESREIGTPPQALEAISPHPESTVKGSAPRSQETSSSVQTQGECSPAGVKTEIKSREIGTPSQVRAQGPALSGAQHLHSPSQGKEFVRF